MCAFSRNLILQFKNFYLFAEFIFAVGEKTWYFGTKPRNFLPAKISDNKVTVIRQENLNNFPITKENTALDFLFCYL